MTMKEVSVVIICLLLISVVRGEDITCQPGEGNEAGKIFTSGLASQCSGLSKITTEAECKLAAEYNRKNNIDKNGDNFDNCDNNNVDNNVNNNVKNNNNIKMMIIVLIMINIMIIMSTSSET